MYFGDHVPPHFHAYYGEYSAQVRIEDFGVETGYLPPKAIGLVAEWGEFTQARIIR